jgi:hypothetical protein
MFAGAAVWATPCRHVLIALTDVEFERQHDHRCRRIDSHARAYRYVLLCSLHALRSTSTLMKLCQNARGTVSTRCPAETIGTGKKP